MADAGLIALAAASLALDPATGPARSGPSQLSPSAAREAFGLSVNRSAGRAAPSSRWT